VVTEWRSDTFSSVFGGKKNNTEGAGCAMQKMAESSLKQKQAQGAEGFLRSVMAQCSMRMCGKVVDGARANA